MGETEGPWLPLLGPSVDCPESLGGWVWNRGGPSQPAVGTGGADPGFGKVD